jgi:tRNA 2-selenouridine synthase SelU
MKIDNNKIKNVINIYDKKKHNNVECQKIKEEWEKYCYCLKESKLCVKERKDCLLLFDNYYKCHINSEKM